MSSSNRRPWLKPVGHKTKRYLCGKELVIGVGRVRVDTEDIYIESIYT